MKIVSPQPDCSQVKPEYHYCFYEVCKDEETGEQRLLVPWSDPFEYEYPFDFLFESEQQALEAKSEQAPDDDWVLCTIRIEPLKNVRT